MIAIATKLDRAKNRGGRQFNLWTAVMAPILSAFAFIWLAPAARAEAPQNTSSAIDALIQDFSIHDPVYFLFGANPSDAKFQLSAKYRLLGSDARDRSQPHPWHEGFFLAYTQTSFWDLSAPSRPFRDTSYKPALIYELGKRDSPWIPGNDNSYVSVAVQHESNGKDGANSRSLNIAYFETRYGVDMGSDWELSVRPRIWTYILDLSENPDIRRYRGNVSLGLGLFQRDGLGILANATGNPSSGKGSFLADLSYPLRVIHVRSYLAAQVFTGYGQSLLTYNKRETRLRVGFSLVR